MRASVRERKSEEEEYWGGLGRERVATRLTPVLSLFFFGTQFLLLFSSLVLSIWLHLNKIIRKALHGWTTPDQGQDKKLMILSSINMKSYTCLGGSLTIVSRSVCSSVSIASSVFKGQIQTYPLFPRITVAPHGRLRKWVLQRLTKDGGTCTRVPSLSCKKHIVKKEKYSWVRNSFSAQWCGQNVRMIKQKKN